jgi:type I restriction enzyme S subunit
VNDKRSWRLVKLGDFAKIISGFAFRSESFQDSGIPVIKIANIRIGQVDLSDTEKVDSNFLSLDEKYHVKSGDILISLTGSHLTQQNSVVGRVALFRDTLQHCLLNQRAGKIIVRDRNICDSRFLFYSLSEPSQMRKIAMLAHGAANQANVSPTQVEGLELALPPLDVQHRIASVLSAYDDLIENNARRIKILEEMAQMIYREWFVNFRFPRHEKVTMVESELGMIPKGWEIKKLFDVAEVTYGYPFKSKLFTEANAGVPVIRIRDIRSSKSATFTSESADSKYIVKNGDLLVGMDGDFHMGKWSGGKAYLNQRVVRFRAQDDFPSYSLFLALKDPIAHFDSTIVGTTVAHLSDRDLRSVSIIKPDAATLEHAKSLLNPCFDLEISLSLKNANLRLTRELLLPKLISGEVEFGEMEAEAAAQGV